MPQRLIFISMLGRFSQLLMRLLSIGHLFLLNVVYATGVLINVLACFWCEPRGCLSVLPWFGPSSRAGSSVCVCFVLCHHTPAFWRHQKCLRVCCVHAA